MTWEPSTLVAADSAIVSCALDEQRILLDLSCSRYYSLNKVGACLWEAMAEPTSVAALQDIVIARFNVSAQQCRDDVDALLTALSGSALIAVHHAPA